MKQDIVKFNIDYILYNKEKWLNRTQLLSALYKLAANSDGDEKNTYFKLAEVFENKI